MRRFFLLSASILTLAILSYIQQSLAAPPTFSFTSSVIGQGTVEPPTASHKRNWQLTVTAIPADGWVFDHWEGDLSGSENPTRIRITSDKDS